MKIWRTNLKSLVMVSSSCTSYVGREQLEHIFDLNNSINLARSKHM
jgi:hypothetical protein